MEKYINGIRFLPRITNEKYNKPVDSFFEKADIIKYIDVSGSDDFELLFKKHSIPFHFSHSNYKNTENLPFISTNGMKNIDGKNNIEANFELDAEYDKNHTDKMNIEDIFEEVFRILQEVEKQLDVLSENK